jgi:hypothetical protein
MKRGLRVLAAAGSLSLALSAADAALAQKMGGILKVGHFDSPASMSMHEESTAPVNRPMMGIFNNLVIYKGGADRCLWRDGLHDRQIRHWHAFVVGPADGQRLCHVSDLHLYRSRGYRGALRLQHSQVHSVHQGGAADRARHVFV